MKKQDSWKIIWNSKIENSKKKSSLKDLINLNGYDSHSAKISTKEWYKYTNFFVNKFKLKPPNSILDIGCGSGAFLYPFYKKNISCYGLDYSSSLIKICKKNMPKGNFYASEASNLKKLKKYNFDFIFISSVFQYFPNLAYAKKVIKQLKFISKQNTKIFILDVPDTNKQNRWIKYIKEVIGYRSYMAQYGNLKHYWYNRKTLKNIIQKENFKVKIFDQKLIKKPNSKFRFNAFVEKI